MTRYCKSSDVKMWITTSVDDELIEELIDQASGEIDKRIGAQSTSDVSVKKLCALIVAYGMMLQRPQSETLGERRVDRGKTLELWMNEIERLYRLCSTSGSIIKSSSYRVIDEDVRYPE